MQTAGAPLFPDAPAPAPPTVRRKLPTQILIGIVLAGIGVVFTGAQWAWNYFGFRAYAGDVAVYIQVEILLGIAETLFLQIGLFLVFWGILKLLPRVRLWAQLGPLLILVGALTSCAVGAAEYLLYYATYPGGASNNDVWLANLLLGASVTAYLALSLGLVVSVAAVAMAVVLRPSPPAVPAPR